MSHAGIHARTLSSQASGKSHLHEGPCRMVRKLRDMRRPLGRMMPSTCNSHQSGFYQGKPFTLKSIDREKSSKKTNMHTLSDLRDAIPCVQTYLASPVRHAIDLFQSQTWSSLASVWSAIGVGGWIMTLSRQAMSITRSKIQRLLPLSVLTYLCGSQCARWRDFPPFSARKSMTMPARNGQHYLVRTPAW